MIEIKGLSKTYSSGKNDVKALKNLSISIGDKGVVFILGKSGCGKTTLLNMLGGIDAPTEGDIIVNGSSIVGCNGSKLDDYRNKEVGFVFQEFNLLPDQCVGENVAIALELQGKKPTKEQIDEFLKKVDLVDGNGETLYKRKIKELSGGQKQRVAIARALCKDPSVILADEPTGALDSETGRSIFKLLKEISEERTVIIVSHDRESAEKYGDRIIELVDGEVSSDIVKNEIKEGNVEKKSEKKRSRLPIKRTFSLAFSGFRHKTFRLITSIILAVMSFTFFGFSICMATANASSAELRELYKNGVKNAFLLADSEYNTRFADFTSEVYDFSDEQLDVISRTVGINAFKGNFCPDFGANRPHYDLNSADPDYKVLTFSQNGPIIALELTENATVENMGLTPDKRFKNALLCRLPATPTEIAITDVLADFYIKFGLKDDDGVEYTIETPDDLIGKSVGDGLTICGVFETSEKKEEYYKLDLLDLTVDEYGSISSGYTSNWIKSQYHISRAVFVGKGYNEYIREKKALDNPRYYGGNFDISVYAVYVGLSGNLSKDMALLNKLTYKKSVEVDGGYIGTKEIHDYSYSAKYASRYSGFTESAMAFMPWPVNIFAGGVAIVFAIFSVILLMNFFSSSIEIRAKEFGILRALGATANGTLGIFVTESAIVAFVDFVLSLICVGIINSIVNGLFFIDLFYLGFVPIFSLLLICLAAVILSSIMPMIKLYRKRPMKMLVG